MSRIRREHCIAWLLLIIMGLIVLHAPLTVFVESRWPGAANIAKAWKELLLLVALVLLCVDVTVHRQWRTVLHDKLLWLAAGYAALHGIVAVASAIPVNATIAGVMIDLRYVAYFVAVYVFLRLYPKYSSSFIKVAVVGAAIVIGFALLQQILPRDFLRHVGYSKATIQPYLTVDENPDFVRHSSTLRGPNPLGAYAVIVLAAAIAYGTSARRTLQKPTRWVWSIAIVGALVALWTSQSRSAWIAAVVAVAIIMGVRYRAMLKGRIIQLLVLAVVIFAVGIYAIQDTAFYHNVILHDNPTTGADIDSNTGHAESLVHGVTKLISNPLGSGVGSTGSASLYTSNPLIIENQFLFIAHEVGWLGLALFLALFVVIMALLWRKRSDWLAFTVFASGIGLTLIGLLLPVWVDDTVSIVWWGLAAIVLAQGRAWNGTPTNKKAKRTA